MLTQLALSGLLGLDLLFGLACTLDICELAAGPQGAPGPQGIQGVTGATGAVRRIFTSTLYRKYGTGPKAVQHSRDFEGTTVACMTVGQGRMLLPMVNECLTCVHLQACSRTQSALSGPYGAQYAGDTCVASKCDNRALARVAHQGPESLANRRGHCSAMTHPLSWYAGPTGPTGATGVQGFDGDTGAAWSPYKARGYWTSALFGLWLCAKAVSRAGTPPQTRAEGQVKD